MRWKKLSPKQLTVFKWWTTGKYDAVIADGSIRSGKTLCMSASFVLWAMMNFDGQNFALCGKTAESLRRNVVLPLFSSLEGLCLFRDFPSRSCFEVQYRGKKNRFYLFGGKDESSYCVIQGITLAGVLFDEAALQPQSFVNQALARCSVKGSKFWFNCNPEHPEHWFKKEWIDKAQEKNALRIHFTMQDNPSLDSEIRQRYERMFTGVFYDRYIRGLWVRAEGRVYPMFNEERHVLSQYSPAPACIYFVSVDYGTVNPFSAGLWSVDTFNKRAVRIKEFYFDSKARGYRMTDEEYYTALERLIGDIPIRFIIVDPSAVSFMECIRRHARYAVRAAENGVEDGIRVVSSLLDAGMLLFCKSCRDSIREFGIYAWDPGSKEKERVLKENDHAMDDIRYFCNTVLRREFRWIKWRKKNG